jgi:hypothetical protein
MTHANGGMAHAQRGRMRKIILLVLLSGCQDPGPPRTVQISVNADGTFTPANVTIRAGDSVEWLLHDRTDAVVPSTGTACTSATPWDASDFTGPRPVAPSGLFSLGPINGMPIADATWNNAGVTGVFIRLLWNEIQPDASRYDFAALDRELDQAVRHGKLYSIAVKAGDDGTPGWIFSQGVAPVQLQDKGNGDIMGCGPRLKLGSPTDAKYRELYFAMLTQLAAHIKTRADWYRALAYVKPSGANLFTHENRLPKRCDPGCACNPRIFAEAGYRPSGLYAFYSAQNALLVSLFPGKTLSYALIQDGFPLVNDAGDYETETGDSSGAPLPKGVEQTETILKQGATNHGQLFAVQHNGLDALHRPNPWVLTAGENGQPTGFQSSNGSEVLTPADVDGTFANELDNTRGMFLELYEDRVNESDLSARTEQLHARRRDATLFPALPDAFPLTLTHTFTLAGRRDYLNPRACAPATIDVQ